MEALLSEPSCKGKARLSVLTHCNTGERGCYLPYTTQW